MIKAVSNTNRPVPRRRQFVIVSILQIILAGVLTLMWFTVSPVSCHHHSGDIKNSRVFLLSPLPVLRFDPKIERTNLKWTIKVKSVSMVDRAGGLVCSGVEWLY